jgi:hypothetical protein
LQKQKTAHLRPCYRKAGSLAVAAALKAALSQVFGTFRAILQVSLLDALICLKMRSLHPRKAPKSEGVSPLEKPARKLPKKVALQKPPG